MLQIERQYLSDSELFVKLSGKIATDEKATELKTKIGGEIDAEKRFVIFELSKVEFIDTYGLGAFISIFKKLKEFDGELILLNAPDDVKDILRITGLRKAFPMVQTIGAARLIVQEKNKKK